MAKTIETDEVAVKLVFYGERLKAQEERRRLLAIAKTADVILDAAIFEPVAGTEKGDKYEMTFFGQISKLEYFLRMIIANS